MLEIIRSDVMGKTAEEKARDKKIKEGRKIELASIKAKEKQMKQERKAAEKQAKKAESLGGKIKNKARETQSDIDRASQLMKE